MELRFRIAPFLIVRELSRLDPRKRRLYKEKKATLLDRLFVVRETGLEPVWINHTPLKRARLPVPPLSRGRLPLYRKRTALSRKISRFSQLFYEIPPAGGTDPLRSREIRVPISCGAGIMPRDGARAIERESWGERWDKERRSRCTQSSPITSRRSSDDRRSAGL